MFEQQVIVKFVKGHIPYNAGESAHFEPDYAKQLVDKGFAVYAGKAEVSEVAVQEMPDKKSKK